MPTMFSTVHMRFQSTTHTVQLRHSSQSHPHHAHYVIHTHTTLQSHCSVLTHSVHSSHIRPSTHFHCTYAPMHMLHAPHHTIFSSRTHTNRSHKHCSVYTPHMTLQFTATLLVHTHYTTHFSIHTHACTNFSPRNTLHTHSSVHNTHCSGVVCRCVPGV